MHKKSIVVDKAAASSLLAGNAVSIRENPRINNLREVKPGEFTWDPARAGAKRCSLTHEEAVKKLRLQPGERVLLREPWGYSLSDPQRVRYAASDTWEGLRFAGGTLPDKSVRFMVEVEKTELVLHQGEWLARFTVRIASVLRREAGATTERVSL